MITEEEKIEKENQKKNNSEEHPSHYQQNGRKECWDEFIDKFGAETTMKWCILTAYKYLYRKGNKLYEDERKDLYKAENYIKKAEEIYHNYSVNEYAGMLNEANDDLKNALYEYNSKIQREKEKMFMEEINNEPVTDDKSLKVKIKYFDKEIEQLEKFCKGDCIDLRTAETFDLKAGEYKLIGLGVGMILPEGYEAHIYPRSSTFKKYGLLLTNSVGMIDNYYSGDNDEWKALVYATRDIHVDKNTRLFQFRLFQNMPSLKFETVERLNDTDRKGYGSTGEK